MADTESQSSTPSRFCLKTLVGDDTYERLVRSLVPQGKGKPPDPPPIDVDQLMRCLTALGGPCATPNDVDTLCGKLEREVDKLNAIKDNIRYHKTVLKKKGNLRLSGTIEELSTALKEHLDPAEEDQLQPTEVPSVPDFTFSAQGQWVAVYYNNTLYVGQVTYIINSQRAMVKYFEYIPSTGFFKWPRNDDEAETEAVYVFLWDLTVTPKSNDLRTWQVLEKDQVIRAYSDIKQ